MRLTTARKFEILNWDKKLITCDYYSFELKEIYMQQIKELLDEIEALEDTIRELSSKEANRKKDLEGSI